VEKLTKETVVLTWFFRGLEDLFFAFRIKSPFRYEPFFNTMAFEMICKAYLLAEKAGQYEHLKGNQAVGKIDKLAKCWGHHIGVMVDEITASINDQDFQNLFSQKFNGYTGDQFVKVMEAAYLESRYPVPNPIHEKFPIHGHPGTYWDPLCSSGLQYFCFSFTRRIMTYLKEKFGITVPKEEFDRIVTGEAGERFCNIFLKDIPPDFFSQPTTTQ